MMLSNLASLIGPLQQSLKNCLFPFLLLAFLQFYILPVFSFHNLVLLHNSLTSIWQYSLLSPSLLELLHYSTIPVFPFTNLFHSLSSFITGCNIACFFLTFSIPAFFQFTRFLFSNLVLFHRSLT